MGTFAIAAFAEAQALAEAAASEWLEQVEAQTKANNPYLVALSGGRIARAFLSAVAAQARDRKGLLSSIHFFWSDERCVPPDDAESNFGLARERLFNPLGIPKHCIHRIRGEVSSEIAIIEAEAEIRRLAPPSFDRQPVLDLAFLGMGEDGHVASLFPGEPATLTTSPAVYRAVTAPKPPTRRITMGYAPLMAARQVWVLIAGKGKAKALEESLSPAGDTPLARLIQSRVHTRILKAVVLVGSPFGEGDSPIR